MPGGVRGLLMALAVQYSLEQGAGPGLEQRKPFFERFVRLEEQVRRFQEVTLNRLQGIAENYNISYNIDAQFQHLTEQFQALSSTVDTSRTSLQGDLASLKFWMKKLQRKSKRMELKVSALEQALGDRTKQASRERKEQSAALYNLTQELDIHRQAIASLDSGRSQLQEELKLVQEAIQGHGAQIESFEEQLKNAMQNEVLSPSSLSVEELPNETPQGKIPGGIDLEPQDKPNQRAKKLLIKHRQRKRLQERFQHLIPSEAGKVQSDLRHDTEAGQQELQMVPEAQASRQADQNWHQVHEPLELSEKSMQEPQLPPEPHVPAEPQVLGEAETLKVLEKSMPDPPMPAALRATRKPPPGPSEQEPPPRATGAICNLDSMLVFPNSSIENVAFFTPGFRVGIPELSICSWLKTSASYLGTILSYATEDNDNKLVLYGRNTTNQGTVQFVIGDPAYRELPVVTLLDNQWHHICVIWSSIQGKYWFYVDRRLAITGSRFQKGYELPPGGSFVLGQEQDTMGGSFDSSEAFVGSLAGLAVWNRALSPGEVSGIATGKSRPRGALLTLADISSVHGFVQRVNCTCLEQCL